MKQLRWFFVMLALTGSLPFSAVAWDDHGQLTRMALANRDSWDAVSFEPVEAVLRAIALKDDSGFIATREGFAKFLMIRGERVNWDWQPFVNQKLPSVSALEVLVYSVDEPDRGMDQDLNLGSLQKYMGGYSGLSSQAIRHMYYRKWNMDEPLATFHFPPFEMGFAVERATRFFELAKVAQGTGHRFWAWRFLGWGLHYLQDLSQPFHTSQFASFELLPYKKLLDGWSAFLAEATRIVSNHHLGFEEFVRAHLRDAATPELEAAFRVPTGNRELLVNLQGNDELEVEAGVRAVAVASSRLASDIARDETALVGLQLSAAAVDLRYKGGGGDTIDYGALSGPGSTAKHFRAKTAEALSYASVATRWFVDRLKKK